MTFPENLFNAVGVGAKPLFFRLTEFPVLIKSIKVKSKDGGTSHIVLNYKGSPVKDIKFSHGADEIVEIPINFTADQYVFDYDISLNSDEDFFMTGGMTPFTNVIYGNIEFMVGNNLFAILEVNLEGEGLIPSGDDYFKAGALSSLKTIKEDVLKGMEARSYFEENGKIKDDNIPNLSQSKINGLEDALAGREIYSLHLTNEADTYKENNTNLPSTIVTLYKSSIELSTGVTFSLESNGGTFSITNNEVEFQSFDVDSDRASVAITATHAEANKSLTKIFFCY